MFDSCNSDYSPPLKQSGIQKQKSSWFKYIIAIQMVIIIALIIAFTKSNNNSETNLNDIQNTDATKESSFTLPSSFPYRNRYCDDPIGLINGLIGRWYGDNGVDTV